MRWFTNQPLSLQFIIAGGIVGVFSVVSLSLLVFQLSKQVKVSDDLAMTHSVIESLNSLGRDLYQERLFLLERKVTEVKERREMWKRDLALLMMHAQNDPEKLAKITALSGAYEQWIVSGDRVLRGNEDPSSRALSAHFRDVFLLIDSMITMENEELISRDRVQKSSLQITFSAIALINILLLFVFGAMLAQLYFSIAQPVSNLSAQISRYQSGDFSARVSVSSESEIGFLEKSFNEMAEKIEVMIKDLRRLDDLKTEFLSTLSHELRTPLTSISGYMALLSKGDVGPVNAEQKDFLKIITANVSRLGHLIDDLLDVSKIEAGKIQLNRERLNVVEILKSCRDSFAPQASEKGLQLRLKLPEEETPFWGDRRAMAQIFTNLISNAVKYTPKGFVEIELDSRDFAVLVKVRDSGVGMDAVDMQNLFSRFYRSRSAIESGAQGTGLGMVIARGLTEAMGGKISVESQPGQGTVFTVSLPNVEGTA